MQREERIKRNQAMLRTLNISQLAADLRASCASGAHPQQHTHARRLPTQAKPAHRNPRPLEPTRKSARQSGKEACEGDQEGGNTAGRGGFDELDENTGGLPLTRVKRSDQELHCY